MLVGLSDFSRKSNTSLKLQALVAQDKRRPEAAFAKMNEL
jgi:hypothetical protein